MIVILIRARSRTDPLRFTYPCQLLKQFQSHGDLLFLKYMELKEIENLRSPQYQLLQQLWRLQDIRDGGGLGFTVEPFLDVLNHLLSTSPPQDSHSALYIATFRVITSDWSEYTHSLGTQKILLDAVASNQGIVRRFNYPTYITDELLSFLDRKARQAHILRTLCSFFRFHFHIIAPTFESSVPRHYESSLLEPEHIPSVTVECVN